MDSVEPSDGDVVDGEEELELVGVDEDGLLFTEGGGTLFRGDDGEGAGAGAGVGSEGGAVFGVPTSDGGLDFLPFGPVTPSGPLAGTTSFTISGLSFG